MISLPLNNSDLKDKAFTHRSYLNEHPEIKEHNERLEFLGDAVLELATSEFLFKKYPSQPEGDLTAYRASLVKTTTLAETATKLGFGEQLKLSKGEELSGGRKNTSLLADTFEAVVGAIYLDQGFEVVVSFLEKHIFSQIDYILSHNLHKDFKSSLQEYVQSKGFNSPEYTVSNESGPDHNKTFNISVAINGEEIATGTGKSKQEAQQNAAKHALEKYKAS